LDCWIAPFFAVISPLRTMLVPKTAAAFELRPRYFRIDYQTRVHCGIARGMRISPSSLTSTSTTVAT